jgi:hypothetical protein
LDDARGGSLLDRAHCISGFLLLASLLQFVSIVAADLLWLNAEFHLTQHLMLRCKVIQGNPHMEVIRHKVFWGQGGQAQKIKLEHSPLPSFRRV